MMAKRTAQRRTSTAAATIAHHAMTECCAKERRTARARFVRSDDVRWRHAKMALQTDETGPDCGGPRTPCEVGLPCRMGPDCTSSVCRESVRWSPACDDGVLNGFESDIDCGGTTCGGCQVSGLCRVNEDCESLTCVTGSCVEASCEDRMQKWRRNRH